MSTPRRLSACAAWLLAAAGLVGCGGGAGGGVPGTVLLTIQFTPDSPTVRIAQVRSLEVVVDGAEQYTTTIAVDGQFAGGPATVRYKPGVASGVLTFRVTARDEQGQGMANGMTSVTILATGEAKAIVVLSLGASASDGGMPDLTVPLDGPR